MRQFSLFVTTILTFSINCWATLFPSDSHGDPALGQIPLASHPAPAIALVPPQAWTALNTSVGGRLLGGIPVGLPCFDNFNGNDNARNDTACDIVEKNRLSSAFLADQMSGYTQGNIPSYYIDVSSVSDVQQAFEFATKWKVPIVVKNSGHDYKGRSAGVNSLALWVHHYTPEKTFDKAFVPDGCSKPVGDVITFGTGEGFDDVYHFADQNDAMIVGGSASSVAPAGGWIGGGGHSALAPAYGLGVDNVQQLRVVLPNGTYVTANRCKNQDLFFALRGGGGGTFGVNMEMSYLTHPRVTVQWAEVVFGNLSTAEQRQLLTVLVQNAADWFDEGWGGYCYPAGATRPNFKVQLINPRLTSDQAKASLARLLEFAAPLTKNITLKTYSNFWDLYTENIKPSQEDVLGGFGLAQTSRLIPRINFEDTPERLVDALMEAVATPSPAGLNLMLLLVTPSQSITDSDSAASPAWRHSLWHAINAANWDPANFSVANTLETFKATRKSFQTLKLLTPTGGAYINEGDTFLNPEAAVKDFWGLESYKRLTTIKKEVDPNNLLLVHGGIGALGGSNPLFSCYPDLST
ncbi:hypothetical protein ANO11243_094380 [Dothideomycetidae sp. 11243]|nr:hypothetical protein ANO11243_094380 [fungal sp. No.11243]